PSPVRSPYAIRRPDTSSSVSSIIWGQPSLRPSTNRTVPVGQPARGGTVSVTFAQSTAAMGSSTVVVGRSGTGRFGRGSGRDGCGVGSVVDGLGVWPGSGGVAVGHRAVVVPTSTATTAP